MSDLFDQLPSGPIQAISPSAGAPKLSANGKRLGRPPGAANKGSIQLAKYVEATFGGMTPGQQSAELALVKPKDLREAKAAAKELGMVDIDLPPMLLAHAVKAKRLAKAIGCSSTEAWVLLAKERMELMAYIHQKQATAPVDQAKQLPTMFVVDAADMAQAQLAAPGDTAGVEILEDFEMPRDEVAHGKSHDAT